MALCLSRFYSNAAISASMSLRICAIAFCSSIVGGRGIEIFAKVLFPMFGGSQGCQHHSLSLLSECPNCGARFKVPALWVDGWCHRCFLPFGEMVEHQKINPFATMARRQKQV